MSRSCLLRPIKEVEKLKSLPLSRIDDEVLGRNVPFYDRWLEKETHSAFAGANFMRDMKKIKIPILHISGWWDGDGIGAKLNWATMRTLGHQDQWLIYGPWGHSVNTATRVRGVDYGPNAVIDLNSIFLRWFDQWLKGKPVKWSEQPKARIFVTGANEWRALEDWPDPRSKQISLYLSSQGHANSSNGHGELRKEPPKEEEPDRYTYNPAGVEIPKEEEEMRDIVLSDSTLVRIKSSDQDALVYQTAPMTQSLEIGGPIELDLYFSTSAKDTDFFAYLVDIDEQDVMRAIGFPGKIRAKYLSGWDQPALLVPDRVYLATIALCDTAHQFRKGHRLGVVIQSQMFPSYARNLNTGEPIKTATRMVAAHQTIYHDNQRPSRLRFYLLPTAEK
jgi:putative CocE/NonD family hydrolase